MVHDPVEKKYLIPNTINLIVVSVCSILYFALLIIASRQTNGYWLFFISFLFGVVMIPVYTLIHEAEHNILIE
jgi:hypothetical protein